MQNEEGKCGTKEDNRWREGWKEEGKPQGRLSLFVFPLPSTGQTVTRKTEARVKEERVGIREGEMENN